MAVSDGAILRIVASMLFPDNVIAQNVFNAVFADTGGSNDTDDVISDLVDWVEAMYTEVAPAMSDEITSSDIKVYEYDSVDDDWDEVGTDTWSVSFTQSSEMLPHGVACVVHGRTIDPDTLGTKYLGGFAEDQQDASDWISTLLTKAGLFLIEWYTPFVGAATGGDFAPVIWSPTDTVARIMNETGYVNGQVGYQRRRKPGVGI